MKYQTKDICDQNGHPDAHDNRTKSSRSTNVFAVLLGLSGLACLAIAGNDWLTMGDEAATGSATGPSQRVLFGLQPKEEGVMQSAEGAQGYAAPSNGFLDAASDSADSETLQGPTLSQALGRVPLAPAFKLQGTYELWPWYLINEGYPRAKSDTTYARFEYVNDTRPEFMGWEYIPLEGWALGFGIFRSTYNGRDNLLMADCLHIVTTPCKLRVVSGDINNTIS